MIIYLYIELINTCNTVPKVIVGDHNQLLWFISDCRSAASVRSGHFCPDTISGETYQSYFQARFITDIVLNPIDDLGD